VRLCRRWLPGDAVDCYRLCCSRIDLRTVG
jgi:hypothetical protein